MAKYNVIDVSVYQGVIDWKKVKAAGIWGAILKAGGSDDGFYTDKYFERNYTQAKAAGLKVGAYYFVGEKCTSTADGKADADRMLKIINGKSFELPVYIDVEAPLPATKEGNTAAAAAFCDEIQKNGYMAGIYASAISGFEDRLVKSALKKYTWWVAWYRTAQYGPDENCAMWQYSSSGSVNGISGRVDMNYCYTDFGSEKTASSSSGSSTATTTKKTTSDYVRKAQLMMNTHNSAGLSVDGVRGKNTNRAVRKFLQRCLNADYGTHLSIDGVIGPVTLTVLGNHYVRRGETQYLVSWVETALSALGYDVNGLEWPGVFGSGLEAQVMVFQRQTGLGVDGVAGRKTLRKLIGFFN